MLNLKVRDNKKKHTFILFRYTGRGFLTFSDAFLVATQTTVTTLHSVLKPNLDKQFINEEHINI